MRSAWHREGRKHFPAPARGERQLFRHVRPQLERLEDRLAPAGHLLDNQSLIFLPFPTQEPSFAQVTGNNPVSQVSGFQAVTVQPGTSGTLSIPGVSITLEHSAGAAGPAVLELVSANNQQTAFDLRILNGDPADRVILDVHFDPQQAFPTLAFFYPALNTWSLVQGSGEFPNSYSLDRAQGTITVEFQGGNTPLLAPTGVLFALSDGNHLLGLPVFANQKIGQDPVLPVPAQGLPGQASLADFFAGQVNGTASAFQGPVRILEKDALPEKPAIIPAAFWEISEETPVSVEEMKWPLEFNPTKQLSAPASGNKQPTIQPGPSKRLGGAPSYKFRPEKNAVPLIIKVSRIDDSEEVLGRLLESRGPAQVVLAVLFLGWGKRWKVKIRPGKRPRALRKNRRLRVTSRAGMLTPRIAAIPRGPPGRRTRTVR